MNWLWFILAGAASGVIAGMGMGGGTLLIPVLTLLLGVSQHGAQGVNTLAFLPAAVLALVVHRKAGRLNFSACLPIIAAGLVGAGGGALLAAVLKAEWLRRGFGIFLIGLSVLQWLGGEKHAKKK